MLTLDSLDLSRLDLLKIDVEGMEIEVLEGARALIESQRPDHHRRIPEDRSAAADGDAERMGLSAAHSGTECGRDA